MDAADIYRKEYIAVCGREPDIIPCLAGLDEDMILYYADMDAKED